MSSRGNYVLLIDPRNSTEDRIIDELEVRYEGLKKLTAENNGQINYMAKSTKTKTSRLAGQEENSVVYINPVEIYKTGINDMEKVYAYIEDMMKQIGLHKETQEMARTKKLNLMGEQETQKKIKDIADNERKKGKEVKVGYYKVMIDERE
ncbi:hypothetical protein ILUMI_09784 [Ignelater luminosus]|uniref:Uncharacterized protein n=1 Tax=Ignelater luminosus TaxID=2038154 RepID=A0A8K0CZ38_IGNLU|nr:hypothetical protein ILUMI_09784 [Ignelater luminosus]